VLGLAPEELEQAEAHLQRMGDALLSHPTKIGTVTLNGAHLLFSVVEPRHPADAPILTARGELFVREGALNKFVRAHEDAEQTSPIFFRGGVTSEPVVIFVAMSFREEQEPALVDYFHAMERAVQQTKLPIVLRRVDLQEGDYEISQQIMNEIDNAQIVIADLTLNSPNVYFELGYARAKKRHIIQTGRKGTALEFDVRNWRTIFYRNATELEERLLGALKDAYQQVRDAASEDE
jgi:hypothetical protein